MARSGPRSIRHVIIVPAGGIGSVPAGTYDVTRDVMTASPITDTGVFDPDDQPFNAPAQVRVPVGVVDTAEISLSCRWASGGHTLASSGAGTAALTPNVWRHTEVGDLFGDAAFQGVRPDVVAAGSGQPVGQIQYRQYWGSTAAADAQPNGPNRTISCYLASDPISGAAKQNQAYELKLLPTGPVTRVQP